MREVMGRDGERQRNGETETEHLHKKVRIPRKGPKEPLQSNLPEQIPLRSLSGLNSQN